MSLEPVRSQVVVGRTAADAFELFTHGMGTWWPLDTHSVGVDEGGDPPVGVRFDGHVGGEIVEVWADGTEVPWGRVTAWDPPARVAFDWRPNRSDRPHTQVEVAFTALADGRTRVELTHTGWERLGEALGAKARAGYEPGWGYVLGERFGGAAG